MVKPRIDWLFVLAVSFSIQAGASAPGEDPAVPPGKAVPDLFVTSDLCMACHNGLITNSGEDVSIGSNWRSSMMANAARDPYWQAAVRREVMDHPSAGKAIQHECAACHFPMTRYHAKVSGTQDEVFSHLPVSQAAQPEDLLAADGVSCTLCHQIRGDGFGTRESFTAGFVIDSQTGIGQRAVYGPFEVERGLQRIMQSGSDFRPEQGTHIQSSEFCATCHTLFTHSLGPGGEVVGELPEQVPYLEWKHSGYRETTACQDCHMQVVDSETPISSVLGEPRAGFSRHSFRGGNFFMPRIFSRYRDELGVVASTQELDRMSSATLKHLESDAASLRIQNPGLDSGRLQFELFVENQAGHKLPTAYPSRRAWLHVTVRSGDGRVLFESGKPEASGAIQGNANDQEGSSFEPHYQEIRQGDQVQIYEAVLADPSGRITTGLLTASQYVKDNRMLPRGFEKASASPDIAVKGQATEDPDFTEGQDRVRYVVEVDGAEGPFSVHAELRYQPIAFRWAQNLRMQKAAETERFVGYYDSMASVSSAMLASDSAALP